MGLLNLNDDSLRTILRESKEFDKNSIVKIRVCMTIVQSSVKQLSYRIEGSKDCRLPEFIERRLAERFGYLEGWSTVFTWPQAEREDAFEPVVEETTDHDKDYDFEPSGATLYEFKSRDYVTTGWWVDNPKSTISMFESILIEYADKKQCTSAYTAVPARKVMSMPLLFGFRSRSLHTFVTFEICQHAYSNFGMVNRQMNRLRMGGL